MDKRKPREWFNALMDYGVMIKATHGNATVRSKSYAKQTKFKGSRRELRGAILRAYLDTKNPARRNLAERLSRELKREVKTQEIAATRKQLKKEGLAP